MNIKLPVEYRVGKMEGVLDHEIGTHFLRKHNEKNQPWYKKRDKFEMKTCIATEEGLACSNQLVSTVKAGRCKPFLFRTAMNYYCACMAKKLSFVDMFKDLEKYADNPATRWKMCLRVKRGLTDTSQKGGLYKDKCYLEGAIQVLSQRKNLDFVALMCGKISLKDIQRPEIYLACDRDNLILPPFYSDMEDYMRCLDVIAETNHIALCDPADNIQLPQREGEGQSSIPVNIQLKDGQADDSDNGDREDNDEEEIHESDSNNSPMHN